jgi:iron complex outermembrane receptor protein
VVTRVSASRGRRRLTRFALLATSALATAAMSTELSAAEQNGARSSRIYAIPAGPLAEALNRLADSAQIQLVYDGDIARDRKTKGLSGTYSAEQALERLLEDSGLTYRLSGDETVTLVQQERTVATDGAVQLDPIDVEGVGQGGPTAPYAGGQVARGGGLGLLGDRDFMDTPFSATAYTEKTIRDQQATSVAEVLTNSDPSVRAAIGPGNRYDALTIRGFRVENSEFSLNGLYGLVPDYRLNPSPVERIELLKGPSAFLSGMPPFGSVGGSVNVVTKRAGDDPLTRVTTDYLSDGHLGAKIDVARRFGDEEQIGVRINGAFADGDMRVDNQSARNGAASLGLDFRGERLRLSADVIYQDDRMDGASRGYIPAAGIRMPKAPDPKINLAQDFDFSRSRSITALSRAEFDVTDKVMLFAAIGANQFKFNKREAPGATILNEAGDARSVSNHQFGKTEALSGEAGVRAKFDTGPVSHEAVISASYLDQTAWLGQTTYASYLTNIYNPIRLPGPGTPIAAFGRAKSSTNTLKSVGVADTLSILDGFAQLTVGARRQQVETANYNPLTGDRTSNYDEGVTTPAVALVIRPNKTWSFYANYIEGLTPITPPDGAVNIGQSFAPAKTKQYEAGVKADFGTFGGSLSVFQISLPTGLLDQNLQFGLNGEQRHRGVEATAFGEIRPGLRLLGGASFIEGELTKTQDGANNGNRAVGVPKFQANVGVEWDTPFAPGVTLLARAIHTSSAAVSADNVAKVPAWTTVDLGGRYTTTVRETPVTFRATVSNVADKRYFIANPTGYVITGAPRMLWLSASADF